ncbi:T9SS C-terminal target domain-containing protein [Bacteroidetes/Chlorobi group bacterium ChocPot_Mid]|nr:MAG: T9SS C-terminal target domain-containing protein [Bacteroidetes/Chlorobi group bacterium ChocPot_Mid]
MINKCIVVLVFFCFASLAFENSFAIEPKDHAIFTNVKIDTTGKLKAIISWIADSNAKDYRIKRKLPAEDDWGLTLASLDSNATFYIDSTIESGVGYEYSLVKNCAFPTDTTRYTYEGYAYIFVGNNILVPDYRGKLLLLIDNSIADSLEYEIERFIYDITGNGWQVVKREVERTENFDGQAVQKVKKIIVDEYKESGGELKALILLGRVAVPYSGDFAVDGHEDHKGAWVADTYYADIDGEWTDEDVKDTKAERTENWNVPGDGKFDQNQIPSDIELQTGRIDFYKLNYFGKSDIEMIRNYLNKNHAYRTGIFKPEYSGVIEDHWGMTSEVFASNGWMEISGLLGYENVSEGKFMEPLSQPSRLWAYGCGQGGYNSIAYTAYVDRLDTMNSGGVFSLFLGSYNGDWDVEDNILRSVLAFSPSALACVWTGRPYWHFHHMGLGYPIGYSTLISQNNQVLYLSNNKYGNRFVHISLLGDPTLIMYVEEPPTKLDLSLEVSQSSSRVYLSWECSDERLLGFNVYRSDRIENKFVKINESIIKAKEFVDDNPLSGRNIYMLRAVRQRETKTGSLINMSQGIFEETEIPVLQFSSKLNYTLKCYPNPAETSVNISFVNPKKEKVRVAVYDLQGKLVKELVDKVLDAGYFLNNWNLLDENGEKVMSGMYFVKFITKNKTIVAKLEVMH